MSKNVTQLLVEAQNAFNKGEMNCFKQMAHSIMEFWHSNPGSLIRYKHTYLVGDMYYRVLMNEDYHWDMLDTTIMYFCFEDLILHSYPEEIVGSKQYAAMKLFLSTFYGEGYLEILLLDLLRDFYPSFSDEHKNAVKLMLNDIRYHCVSIVKNPNVHIIGSPEEMEAFVVCCEKLNEPSNNVYGSVQRFGNLLYHNLKIRES